MFGLFKKGIDHYGRELASPSPRKRAKAARGLGKVKGPRALSLLVEALGDTAGEVRAAAAYALGDLGDQDAVQLLVRVLEDHDQRVRVAAADSLLNLGDSRGLEPLLKMINDPNEEDPNETVALRILHMRGMELLVRALKEDANEEVRRLVVLVLTCAGPDDPPGTEAITHAGEEDAAEEVRKAAADALELMQAVEGRGHREAFCLKCRANQAIRDPRKAILGSGLLATVGTCPIHGTTVFRLGRD